MLEGRRMLPKVIVFVRYLNLTFPTLDGEFCGELCAAKAAFSEVAARDANEKGSFLTGSATGFTGSTGLGASFLGVEPGSGISSRALLKQAKKSLQMSGVLNLTWC